MNTSSIVPLSGSLSKPANQNALCALHGTDLKRADCHACNASYMRTYMRSRRRQDPALALFNRARDRARKKSVPFTMASPLTIPLRCPVLNTDFRVGERRNACSPSLDRIDPAQGYEPGNVRIISDRANRLKGDRALAQLLYLATNGPKSLRRDYALVAAYVEREHLLSDVRQKAQGTDANAVQWQKVERFLDQSFTCGSSVFRNQEL